MIFLFLLLFAVFYDEREKKLEICVKAGVAWTLFLLFLCFFWSAFQTLCRRTLAVSYFLMNLMLIALIIFRKRKDIKIKQMNEFRKLICSVPFYELAGVFLLFVSVLYYAVKSVPYNWDSMTYHLARIVNWEQNCSVFPYATHIERQVTSPVLGAYVNLFVYILGGKHDRMLNLLQCMSFGINALLVYGIVRKLGVGIKLSFLAPVLYMCTPIALAEATTTQVDNFATVWLLAFLYLMLDLMNVDTELEWNRETRSRVVFSALCIALGYLAKPSICFAVLIFLIWLLMVSVRRRTDWKIILQYLLLSIPVLILTVTPNLLCNVITFGSISHSSAGERQLVGTWNPRYMFVNFVKNVTFNLVPAKREAFRPFFKNIIYRIAGILQVDPDDPAISEDGRVFEFPDIPALNCDVALNMFLSVAVLLAFVWFLLRIRKQKQMIKGFSVYAVSSFLLFCCFLRWEKFINRYMIAYFALLAIFIVVQVHDMMKTGIVPVCRYGVCTVLVICSLMNFKSEIQYLKDTAPFVKPDGYFTYNPDIKDGYISAISKIQSFGSGKIGLVVGQDSFEYPLWSVLQNQGYEIKHIMVSNMLGKYEDMDYVPDYILVERGREGNMIFHGENYRLKNGESDDYFGLYVKDEKQ